MSGHGDPHEEAHGDDAHEHDDHHAPPPLPEPATPLWLTVLGIGLFLVVGIFYVATRDTGKTTAELTSAPGGADSAAPPADAAGAARLNAPPNPPGSPQPAVRP